MRATKVDQMAKWAARDRRMQDSFQRRTQQAQTMDLLSGDTLPRHIEW